MISGSSVLPRSIISAIFAGVAVVVALLTWSPSVRAQVDAGRDEISTLEKSLADESSALTTSDCATACRALASIRRAAEKICALDPDARCTAARRKAEDATRRVRDACPDCAIASAPLPAPPREERAMGKGGSSPDRKAGSESPVSPASAPPAESERGGCRSCTTSPSSPGDFSIVGLTVAALAFTLRRRRSTRGR